MIRELKMIKNLKILGQLRIFTVVDEFFFFFCPKEKKNITSVETGVYSRTMEPSFFFKFFFSSVKGRIKQNKKNQGRCM